MRYLTFLPTLEKYKPHVSYYKFVDHIYQSNIPIELLEYLNQKFPVVEKPIKEICYIPKSNNKTLIFNDQVWIGESSYLTQVYSGSKSTYHLKFNSQEYTVNKYKISINSPILDTAILMGPVLITNLAINQVFCLHASAFLLKGKAFVLMGDSGTGKSTIAKFMDKLEQCARLADDILPIKIKGKSIALLPSFPQLKLPNNQQYKGKDVVKETILLFAKKSKNKTNIEPIDKFLANKKLIQHSVATKLFARRELQNHLSFCHKTCSLARSYQVNYQHSDNSLEQLFTLLNEVD